VNGDGPCARARQELGVYLVGAIEPAQRAWLGRHLASCAPCRAELAGLAGLPALLRKVPAGEAIQPELEDAGQLAPGPPLSVLAGRVSRIRRRWRLTAAAAFLAGIAAVLGWQLLHPPARPPAAAVTAAGANPVTRAWAAIRYTARPWGTELAVRVTGVAAGTRCQFWVTSLRGQDVVTSSRGGPATAPVFCCRR
jgi:hypothetical protein